MNKASVLSQWFTAIAIGVLGCNAGWAQPGKQHLRLDPAQTEVHFTLKDTIHTVHGTFKMSAGAIDFDPRTGEASGQIAVDTSSGASGNDSRDGKMKREYLEVPSFPVATYEVEHVNGYDAQKSIQKITVNGTMTLHGTKHALVLEFALSRDGQATVAVTHFLIPYVAWGIKDPSNAFIHVEKEVLIEITARGSMAPDKLTP
jgi:polyisoprenoid-binding protein YceI